MDNIYAARFTQMIDHLRHGKLFHDRFDMRTWHYVDRDGKSHGCALAELPSLHPDEVTTGGFLTIRYGGVDGI